VRSRSDVSVSEVGLAQQLGVSRTPVRAALALLARRGVLKRVPGAGYALRGSGARLAAIELDPPIKDADRVFLAIAKDRLEGRLPDAVSEADLMRRYEVTRPTILKVLARLAEVGQVERKTGHGWAFLSSINDVDTRLESYRFRLLIEPAGLTEPVSSSMRIGSPTCARATRRCSPSPGAIRTRSRSSS
jgi:DNA-binding GntR family transcriptional regulator